MKPDIVDQEFSPYTMASVIIGTKVEQKPNFMVCTWVSRVNRNPPMWMASVNNKHYSLEGIKTNQSFSMNFPSTSQVKETDYVGITSGRKVDKSKVFEIFYGETDVPLIKTCPFSIELTLTHSIRMQDHTLLVGTAQNSYLGREYYTDGLPDMSKMDLMIYTGIPATYWSLGKIVGKAFSVGQDFNYL